MPSKKIRQCSANIIQFYCRLFLRLLFFLHQFWMAVAVFASYHLSDQSQNIHFKLLIINWKQAKKSSSLMSNTKLNQKNNWYRLFSFFSSLQFFCLCQSIFRGNQHLIWKYIVNTIGIRNPIELIRSETKNCDNNRFYLYPEKSGKRTKILFNFFLSMWKRTLSLIRLPTQIVYLYNIQVYRYFAAFPLF